MRGRTLAAIMCCILALSISHASGQNRREDDLRKVLGLFPAPPPLEVTVLETVKFQSGLRHKIEYTVEPPDPRFDRPVDKVRAYLFVPTHDKGQRLPAIVAVHQDGVTTHLGKKEPAGIDGAQDQHYGLDLFERGYVVICPDRYGHAERRRIPNADDAPSEMMRDLGLWLKWAGQLILVGRTHFGKEAYDLMRAVDVLNTLEYVDAGRIAAIGHSAGGNVLVYFMFMDKRVRAGVSSCGFYELLHDFNDTTSSFANSVFALPSLAIVGSSADYLGYLAPRPFLMTRGLSEMESAEGSAKHVEATKAVEKHARERYRSLKADDKLQAIYFSGTHAFPTEIRRQAYEWLDKQLGK
jgi:dienelactone hydrolase